MHEGVSKMDGAPGRGSGRYPLGSGDRPRALFRLFGKKSAPSILKRTSRYSPEEFEEMKSKAIENGDLEFIKDNYDRFTSRELNTANSNYITRQNFDSNYNSLMRRKNPDLFYTLDKFNNKMSTIVKTTENVEKGIKALSKIFGVESDNGGKKKKKNND